jgi:hypothetical protein
MPKPITPRIVVKFLDGDIAKANRLKGLLIAKQMIRRDANGAVIVDNIIQGGGPPGGGPP